MVVLFVLFVIVVVRLLVLVVSGPGLVVASTDSLIKAKLMQTQRINGTVQMEHYTPRVDTLAPLVLPQIDNGYLTETHKNKLIRQNHIYCPMTNGQRPILNFCQ
jgi:hypothetical protein